MVSSDSVLNDYIKDASFITYSSEDILKISVKQITQPMTVTNLGVPVTGGLHDSSLGATDLNNVCSTCHLNERQCPGHFGHIKLSLPVFNPLFFKLLQNLLRGTCFFCHRPYIKNLVKKKFLIQYKLIRAAKFIENDLLEGLVNRWTLKMLNKIEKEHDSSSVIEELILSKIDRFYRKNISKNSSSFQSDTKTLTNTVISRLDEHLRTFMNGTYLDAGSKYCNHCGLSKLKLQSEFSTVFVLKPAKNDTKYQQKLKSLTEEFIEGSTIKINDQTYSKNHYLTALDARIHMNKVWNSDAELICTLMNRENSHEVVDSFFMDHVLVVPPKFRPVSVFGDSKYENPMTVIYVKIITASYVLNEILHSLNGEATPHEKIKLKIHVLGNSFRGKESFEKIQSAWNQLQTNVNGLVDAELVRTNSKDRLAGIRQILEKKEGLFRMHMMGKRVNYAARSVITPDPYLDVDEVGLPEIFASKLTFPEPVTDANFHRLQSAVLNGPANYPGANIVEKSSGHKIFVQAHRPTKRDSLAKQLIKDFDQDKPNTEDTYQYKKVYRHVVDGDIVLMNRQPTLHRPSIMAHRVRVLPKEKTIRMHYANCKSYNADFDGDEMNSHCPQTQLARSEAYNLVSTSKHYLSPRDGKPLTGLIQDYMISGVILTMQDRFFTRDQYHQLVYAAFIDFPGRIKTVSPVILKPYQLWTGKAIVSTIMLNVTPRERNPININSTSKLTDNLWNITINDPILKEMTDSQVVIRDGELLVGILDKNQFGASPYGIIHSFFEVYGGCVGSKLLSVLGRLFIAYLQVHGFTLGIEDTICLEKAQSTRNSLIDESKMCGFDVLKKAFLTIDTETHDNLSYLYKKYHCRNNLVKLNEVEFCAKHFTNEYQNQINRACLPIGLMKTFPLNNLQLMIQSGAKGTSVNAMQISCLLGQIELEGKRPQMMTSGKTLPCFKAYDPSIASSGFTTSSFLSGLQPSEFFFHCMAGREGLVDTAVKTSRSGYLQRCLIKHMEGLAVNYDLSVRDSDGSIVQFLYGEDGCDTTKIQFAFDSRFDLISMNHHNFYDELNVESAFQYLDVRKASKYFKSVEKSFKSYSRSHANQALGYKIIGYHSTFNHKLSSAFQRYCTDIECDETLSAAESKYKAWYGLDDETKNYYLCSSKACLLPVLTFYTPTHYMGSVSEMYNDLSKGFIKKEIFKKYSATVINAHEENLKTISNIRWKCRRKLFEKLIKLKYVKSLVDPGESVGILAGQSVGEPSTQMTLNTFHFAGRGEMNVTLGIPRLREILLVGSAKIKTPTFTIPLLNENPESLKAAQQLSIKLTPIAYSTFLRKVTITHNKLYDSTQKCLVRSFTLKFDFIDSKLLKQEYDTSRKKMMSFSQKVFLKKLAFELNKATKSKKKFFIVNEEKSSNKNTNDDTRHEIGKELEEDITYQPATNEDDNCKKPEALSSDEGGDHEDYCENSEDVVSNEESSNDADNNTYRPPLTSTMVNNENGVAIPSMNNLFDSDSDEGINYLVKPSPLLANVAAASKHTQNDKTQQIKHVLRDYEFLSGYNFDDKHHKWFEINFELPANFNKTFLNPLIKRVTNDVKYNYVADITRCFVKPSNKVNANGASYVLTIEGDNIQELWKYGGESLDFHQLYCNNIQKMASLYGIEAARVVLIKEIQNVFGAYGITVNYRHLSLVADYMTFRGTYNAFNRFSFTSCPSPFQKMSYETTMNFLRYACTYGQNDPIQSPSARLVVGRPVHVGTDFFDVLTKLSTATSH